MKLFVLIAVLSYLSFANNNIFIKNDGQINPEILYFSQIDNMNLFIKDDGIYFDFYNINEENSQLIKKGEVVKFNFIGSNKFNSFKVDSKAQVNYFIGNDKLKWLMNVPVSEEILIKNIYENIDMRLYFDDKEPRYDFIVHPGGNVNDIKFSISNLKIKQLGGTSFKGDLAYGEYSNEGLSVFQGNKKIDARFRYNMVSEDEKFFTFVVGEYDKSKTLIIDPIIYSSYMGWNGKESVEQIRNINEFSYLVAGNTISQNFPVTEGVYQDYVETGTNIFIAEYKRNGTIHEFIRGTYFGGNQEDFIKTMAIDNNNIYFGGYTTSTNFPYLGLIGQASFGKKDGFVTSLSLDMTTLNYSYYIGAEEDDEVTNIKVKNGEVFFCGNSNSIGLNTIKPLQSSNRGGREGIIGKNNAAGSKIEYLTYVGGSGDDQLNAIEITDKNEICWIGSTNSFDILTTEGATSKATGNNYDMIMGMYNVDLTGNLLTTYLGGTSNDYGVDLKYIDGSEFFFVGYSEKESAPTLPLSEDLYQKTNAGQIDILFGLRKLTELNKLTYIGGEKDDIPFKLDKFHPNGDFVIVGETDSKQFPILSEVPEEADQKGKKDGFVVFLSEDLKKLTYSSFIGGKNDDRVLSLDVIGNNKIRFVGKTFSKDLTLYGYSNQTTNSSGDAGFIGEINPGSIALQFPLGGDNYCPQVTVPISFLTKKLENNSNVSIYLINEVLKSKELIVGDYSGTSYDWKIPIEIIPDKNYIIQIEHSSGVFSKSPITFGINPSPSISKFQVKNDKITYCIGDSLVFGVEISNASNPIIYWEKDGKLIQKNNKLSFVLSDLKPEDTGVYKVRVEGDCLPYAESEEIFIEVFSNTEIVNNSDNQMLNIGDKLNLFVSAKGGNLAYQWKFKGNDLAGKIDSILTIQGVQEADAGNYACQVNGECGEVVATNDIIVQIKTSSVDKISSSNYIFYDNSKLNFTTFVEENGDYQLTINDLLGKNVLSEKLTLKKGNNNFSKNITFESGFYFVNISNGKEIVTYKLIVKK